MPGPVLWSCSPPGLAVLEVLKVVPGSSSWELVRHANYPAPSWSPESETLGVGPAICVVTSLPVMLIAQHRTRDAVIIIFFNLILLTPGHSCLCSSEAVPEQVPSPPPRATGSSPPLHFPKSLRCAPPWSCGSFSPGTCQVPAGRCPAPPQLRPSL